MKKIFSEAYEVASVLAERKEQAIKAAFDHYFGEWSEESIGESNIEHVVLGDGTTTLNINNETAVIFMRIYSDIEVNGKTIIVRYRQDIVDLYEIGARR